MQVTIGKSDMFLLILGLLGILDTFFVLLFSSINLGTVLPAIIGSSMICWSITNIYFQDLLQKYNLRRFKRIFGFVFVVWLISFLAILGLIVNSQVSEEKAEADYLIILGAGLRGENLSQTLYTRMVTGLDYLNKNPQMQVIVSGGRGYGEAITEAEAMKRFLIFNGIAADRILKEESSTSTFENFKHSKEQVIGDGGQKVIIVTNDFHMFRAKMLAERAGLTPYGLPSKTPYIVLLNCYLREYFAIIKSYVFDK